MTERNDGRNDPTEMAETSRDLSSSLNAFVNGDLSKDEAIALGMRMAERRRKVAAGLPVSPIKTTNDPLFVAERASAALLDKELSSGKKNGDKSPSKRLQLRAATVPRQLSTAVLPHQSRRGRDRGGGRRSAPLPIVDIAPLSKVKGQQKRVLTPGLASVVVGKTVPRKNTTSPEKVKRGWQKSGGAKPLENFYKTDNPDFGRSFIMEVEDAYREYCGLHSTAELSRDDGRWPEFAFEIVSGFHLYLRVLFQCSVTLTDLQRWYQLN